jgi:hypothetical protein
MKGKTVRLKATPMSDFNIEDCTAGCQQWLSCVSEEHRAEVHRTWHENRVWFADQLYILLKP